MWKEICAFVKFATPVMVVVSAFIVAAFASLPLAWAARAWVMYWFPEWEG